MKPGRPDWAYDELPDPHDEAPGAVATMEPERIDMLDVAYQVVDGDIRWSRVYARWMKENPGATSETFWGLAKAAQAAAESGDDADYAKFNKLAAKLPAAPATASDEHALVDEPAADKASGKRDIPASAMVPRAIIRDPRLSLAEKMTAVGIADAVNYGKWNIDLHVVISQRDLARRINVALTTVNDAIVRLEKLGYLEVNRLPGTGGTWFRFRPEMCELARD